MLFDFSNLFSWLWDAISIIPKIVYYLCVSGMSLLDVAQLALRKMAGLDVYYIGDSATPQTGDIALSFVRSIFDKNTQYPAIKNAFWSLVILSVILLIITTIIAVVRQEYMPGDEESKEKPQNSKIHVMARSVKSLFLFLIVPVSVIFGLTLSDIFLRAIDSATSAGPVGGTLFAKESIKDKLVGTAIYDGSVVTYTYMELFGIDNLVGDLTGFSSPATGTVTFSGVVFKIGAYTANRVRLNDEYKVLTPTGVANLTYYELLKADENYISNFGIFNQADSPAEAAQMIDEAFAANARLKNPERVIVDGVADNFNSRLIFGFGAAKARSFSKFNIALVWYYYDLWQFNFLVAFAVLVIMLKLMVKITAGLMKRIIEMVALFIISPPIVAVMPLDGGKAFGEWRKNFIGKALGAYGAIIGMNLFFLILPYLNEIKFFAAGTGIGFNIEGAIAMVNLVFSTIFIVTGLVVVESFIELLSGIVGSESLAKTGGELVGKVGDTMAKSGKYLGGAAGFTTKLATSPFTLTAKATHLDKWAANKLQDSKRRKREKRLGEETTNKFNEQFQEAWNDDLAVKAYDENASNNKGYKDDMTRAYQQRQNKDLSYDEWIQSQEGQAARDQAAQANGLQTFESFKNLETETSRQVFNKMRNDSFDQTYPELAAEAAKTKRKGAIASEIGEVAKHFSGYASNFPLLVSGVLERNDKQGFKSMIMAFQGKTAKQIELEEIYTRIKDEESQKAIVQEESRKEQEKQYTSALEKKIGKLSDEVEKLKRRQD
jgi:hypothetical protein